MIYNIEETLEGDYDDYYASYDLVAEGNTLEELIDDAHIFEVDQDGGSGKDYKLVDASTRLFKDAVELFERTIEAVRTEAYSDESKRNPDTSPNGD